MFYYFRLKHGLTLYNLYYKLWMRSRTERWISFWYNRAFNQLIQQCRRKQTRRRKISREEYLKQKALNPTISTML